MKKTPPPDTLFAAFCGACGKFIGASATKDSARMWWPSQCIPGHGRTPVVVIEYTAANNAAGGRGAGCVTPNGRTDGHGVYIEMVDGVMLCAFCKAPVDRATNAAGPDGASGTPIARR